MKAIIFDCFGVLTNDPWKEFVATLPEDQVEPARALNYQLDAAQITQEEFINKVQELTGRSPEGVSAIRQVHDRKNRPLLDYIRRELKPVYKIGLLSNVSTNWIREEFLSDDDLALFTDTLMSYEVRLIKPQPEIFLLAAERLEVPVSDCLLVDDSEVNCSGAKHVGMQAIVYRNLTDLKQALQDF